MSNKGHIWKPSRPDPAIVKRGSREQSLDLKNVDMSREGVQGDVVVSKGRAGTFVTKLHSDEDSDN
ncbi:hypothetical protein FE844_027580 (plasmid) [Rhizobium indicum]|uniref:hypothetical protein n=1 Tax=Rhizobium indicum TaxID=2583231 RepID=UPI001106037B|nr:hypothetical protein [Rhizobium indicum]QKK33324.1 hypothetical protein FE844_027580 [Rhizobium indicum]